MDKAQIVKLIEQQLAGTDRFIVDVKLSPSRLAVFIDKPSGILLDECAELSRFLLNELENDPMLESHDVEVSSPGMDSPLMVPQQYMRRIGRELKVQPLEGKEIKGLLLSAGDSGIELKETVTRKENKKKIISEVLHTIPYSNIREAKLVINLKFK